MTHDDEEIWLRAYCAALVPLTPAANRDDVATEAYYVADAALLAYHDRWDRKHALPYLLSADADDPDWLAQHLPTRYLPHALEIASTVAWLQALEDALRWLADPDARLSAGLHLDPLGAAHRWLTETP